MKSINVNLFRLVFSLILFINTLPAIGVSSEEWRFTTYTTNNGLANDYIRSLGLDDDGYLWIGTINGLNRFDGYTFKQYGTLESENKSVPVPFTKSIFLTKDKTLLFGTQHGILAYDKEQDQIIEYSLTHAINTKSIRAINENEYGLWVGTNIGLFNFNLHTGKIKQFTKKNSSISSDFIQSIHFVDKEVWIGTFDGICIMNMETNNVIKLPIAEHFKFGIKNNFIECLAHSPFNSNKVYAGTQTGLYEIDKYSKQVSHISSLTVPEIKNNSIKSIRSKDNLLFCTTEEGILIFDGKKFTSIKYNPSDPYSLSNNIVWDILPITNNLMWVATQQGLALSEKIESSNQFHSFYKLKNFPSSGLQVYSAYQKNLEKMWIGSQYGLCQIDNTNGSMITYSGKDPKFGIQSPIRSITEDANGLLWLASSEGLECFNSQNNKLIELPKLIANQLKFTHSVVVDKQSVFSANYDGKLQIIKFQYLMASNKVIITNSKIIDLKMPTAKMIKYGESIWLLCSSYGLIRYDIKTNGIRRYSAKDKKCGLISDRVNIIHVSNDHKLWVGLDDALQCYDPKADDFKIIASYPKVKNIHSIQSDSNANIWFSTFEGISKYNSQTGKISKYAPLQWREFKGNSITATLCNANNQIYFFSIDGFFMFTSNNLESLPNVKPIFLSDLLIDGVSNRKEAQATQDRKNFIQISVVGKKSVELQFTNLEYDKPDLVQYIYKDEDTEWQNLSGPKNRLLFTDLAYGLHRIEVKSVNSDGVESENSLYIDLDIIRPWWISWWMMILYVLSVGTVGWQLYKLVSYKYKMATTLKLERDENERKQMLMDLKQRLFTNISHDFKTPLSLIISPVETLLDTVEEPVHLDRLKIIRDNAQRLLRLVNQTIDIKRIENELLQLNREPTNLSSLIDSVMFTFSEYSKAKGVVLLFENESKNLVFDLDVDKIEKVVYNMLSNAVKFTNSGGSVILTLRTNDLMKCEIIVSDTGIGIPDKDIPYIFERYYQSDESRANMAGSGIGLTIVKEYVELHDGTISVTSKEHSGTTFCISLPIVNLSQPESTIIPASVHQSGKPNLLIIEDNQELGNYLISELMDRFVVTVEKTGESGFKKAQELLPQIIIQDIMLPGIDGIETCKLLKNDFLTSHIPVIVYSAKNNPETRAQTYDAHADAFLQKPFTLKVLMSLIENILQRQKKQIEENNNIEEIKKIKDPSPNELFLQKVLDLVEQNISNSELDAQFICAKLGMSYVTFYRKMISLTGDSINTYIRNIRIQKAADLMHLDGYNVSDIMYEVGFNNRSYFSLCFKEKFGLTPKQYLKENNKKNNNDEEDEIN